MAVFDFFSKKKWKIQTELLTQNVKNKFYLSIMEFLWSQCKRAWVLLICFLGLSSMKTHSWKIMPLNGHHYYVSRAMRLMNLLLVLRSIYRLWKNHHHWLLLHASHKPKNYLVIKESQSPVKTLNSPWFFHDDRVYWEIQPCKLLNSFFLFLVLFLLKAKNRIVLSFHFLPFRLSNLGK